MRKLVIVAFLLLVSWIGNSSADDPCAPAGWCANICSCACWETCGWRLYQYPCSQEPQIPCP